MEPGVLAEDMIARIWESVYGLSPGKGRIFGILADRTDKFAGSMCAAECEE